MTAHDPIRAADDCLTARRYDLADLIAQAGTEPPWRVGGFAADGHLTVLSATGGEGKTWLGMALAGGVAAGTSIAGMQCTVGRAVVFDAENGPYVLGSRLAKLDPGLPADRVAIHDAEGKHLSDPADVGWMLEVLHYEQANLFVLDSLRALAPRAAENESDEMAPVIIAAKNLARHSGAAGVLITHRGHNPNRAFRGSSVIRDQTDLLFVLERAEDDSEKRFRRRLWCDKCRIAEEPSERWLRIDSWHGEVALRAAPKPGSIDDPRPKAGRPRKRDALRAPFLEALRDGPRTLTSIADAVGDNRRTTERVAQDLIEAGDIVAYGDGYTLAERSGKKVLPLFAADGGEQGRQNPPLKGVLPPPVPPTSATSDEGGAA